MEIIKHYEVQLSVDGLGVSNKYITWREPVLNNGDGFVELSLEDGVQMFDRSRVSQITIKPITE
jgi:hypothetical protein